jgi:hypothetical protein
MGCAAYDVQSARLYAANLRRPVRFETANNRGSKLRFAPQSSSTVTKTDVASIDVVASVLAGYAGRRVFHGFSRGRTSGGKASFQIAWHRGRVFELAFDADAGTLRLPELLTGVPADSTMYGDLKAFIRSRQSGDLPDHRRLDRHKIQIRTYNRGGIVSLVLKAKDGDSEYAVRKLVHLINEIYLIFLADGKYFEYLVETFNLDPDRM